MTYPDPRYFRSHGEVSAVYRPAATGPNLSDGGGNEAHYLATGDSTDGLFGMYKSVMGPEPAGTRTHFHKTVGEAFYMLEGSLHLYNGERWIDTEPGDFIYVPPGGLHGFENISGESVSFLMLFAPGAPREGYFEGVSRLAQMSDAERAEFFEYHDSHFGDEAGPTGSFLSTKH